MELKYKLFFFLPLFLGQIVTGRITLLKNHLPTTTLEDLKRFHEQDLNKYLRDFGGKIGSFSVTNLGMEYSSAVERFQTKGSSCIFNDSGLTLKSMTDGSLRKTFASEEEVYPDCVFEEAKIIAKTFKLVENLVSNLIIQVSGQQGNYFLNGKKFSILDAPLKDHLHVYSKAANESEEPWGQTSNYLVPNHVDNGLFLIITPFSSPSLEVKLSTGQKINTQHVRSDSVIVLIGRGLTDWLLPQNQVIQLLYSIK